MRALATRYRWAIIGGIVPLVAYAQEAELLHVGLVVAFVVCAVCCVWSIRTGIYCIIGHKVEAGLFQDQR